MKRTQVFPANYFSKSDVEEGPVTGAPVNPSGESSRTRVQCRDERPHYHDRSRRDYRH
jgi:hypothetical protein